MIDQLIAALSKEVEMSAEEIADTIWLALQMQEFQTESVSSSSSPEEKEINKQESQLDSETSPETTPNTSDFEKTSAQLPTERKAGVYPKSQQKTSESLDISFKVPDAPSLREPLTLARALKPLMRRIPSGRELILDEAATIQQIADEKLWTPILKPTLEPWLDLELVVDEAISMQIWRHTIRELERLLKNYGIFRDVRVWGLVTNENEQVQIRRGVGATAKNETLRSPKELIDPSGRRLILVVSDCVSSFWRNGKVTPVLELWAKQGSMAIVQMLPKWLWKRTALGRASEVRLRGLTPGVVNQKLIAKEVSLWDELEEESGVKVPVFTLEEDKVVTWAQMLSGKGSIWTLGYVFKLNATSVKKETGLFNLARGDLSAEQRVQAFRVTASPMARKLAGLLASAPVISLPIVRLIREALLKNSQQVHVAEVFLGGLLKPLSKINADTNPDYVQYEFMDGVRELLIDSVPSKYVLNVVDEVSKYVAKKAGLSLENFAAVLRNPQQIRDSEVADNIGYFATVTAEVLRSLGGEYVRLAGELDKHNTIDYQNNSQTTLDSLIEYQIGGCLPIDSPSYIKRKADNELYNAVKSGQLCIVSAPVQMGKSSLILRIINNLKQEEFVCAAIDLTLIGNNKISFKDFCYSLINILVDEFNLNNIFNLKDWWKAQESFLGYSTIFRRFIERVLLKAVNQKIIIFIDELDWLIDTDFIEEFLMLLRGLYESQKYKSINNTYSYNFVLSGIFNPSELHSIENRHTSPFNIGKRIQLEEFTYEEALPLASGLEKKADNPQKLLINILEWTGGQPFLTQKLCNFVKKSEEYIADGNEKAWLDNLVQFKIIENWEEQDSPPHLLTIRNRIFSSTKVSELLKLYNLILEKSGYIASSRPVEQELISTGLVIRRERILRVTNQIYSEVFNHTWIEQSLAKLSNTALTSNPEIDYTQLRNLLAHQKWKEADEETFKIMLKVTNREKEKTLDYQAIKNASCANLNTIDKLWIDASKGRFGFSIQLKKWQAAGGKANKETEHKLGNDIGWYVNDKWISDISEFTFDLLAPVGHLPVKWTFHLGGTFPRTEESVLFSYLAQRLFECNINNLEISSQTSQPKLETNLQIFGFETVTVNHQSKIIKTETKQVQYFVEKLSDNTSLEMLLIPGGTFTMGAPEDEEGSSDDERPQHQVTVPMFFMSRYQITQAQWRAVANLPQVKRRLEREPSYFKGDNLPVEQISWYDAVEFCDRLSKHTDRNYRLPSEAEWEYACRAGTTTPFYVGETISTDLANYRGTENDKYKRSGFYGNGPKGIYRQETTPVGNFDMANAFGLSDIHGNVWEWCLDDYYDNYERAPIDGSAWVEPTDNDNDNYPRILRGGSWVSNPVICRCANRYKFDPYDYYNHIGMRVACSIAL